MATMRGVGSAPKSSVFFSNSMSHPTFCHFERSRENLLRHCVKHEFQRCFDFAQDDKMKTVSPSIVFLSIFLPALAFAQHTPHSLADAELPSLLTIYKDID